MGYKCLCPIGLVLEEDGCMELARCKGQEHYCHRSNECIEGSKKCNGVKDCKFGEDEENCARELFLFCKIPHICYNLENRWKNIILMFTF